MKFILKNIFLIFLLLSSKMFLTNCGKQINCCVIKLPPVTFTSERTSLESQILGTYQEIREDVWLVSSSQTVEGLKISSTTNTNMLKSDIDYKIIKALETIEYNKNLIKQYKNKGFIGENNEGLLSYISSQIIEYNPKEKEKLFETINEVNNSRLVLMLEVINKNENLTLDDLNKVKKTFASLNIKNARKGEWIQDDEGNWQRKQ